MAQHQLPLNSLGSGGGVEDLVAANSYGGDGGPSASYAELSSPVMPQQHNHHHNNQYNNNSSNNSENNAYHHHNHAAYPPLPYPQIQDDRCYVGQSSACTSSSVLSSSAVPPLSGSLPPITSFGQRPSSSASSHSLHHHHQLPPQHQQQFSPASPFPAVANRSHTSNGGDFGAVHHQQQQPQFGFHMQHSAMSSPMMDNHYNHLPQHHQAMQSPAYSAQNSVQHMNNHSHSSVPSNPGSIISAPPESPKSASSLPNNRSPSVRSNYSLRMMVNSTPPDAYMAMNHTNNGGSSELHAQQQQHNSDSFGQMPPTPYGSGAGGEQHMQPKTPMSNSSSGTGAKKKTSTRTPKIKTPSSVLPPLIQQQQQQQSFDPQTPDGPTVKQHLQQQQAAKRQQQQHEMMVRKLCAPRREEPAETSWSSGSTTEPMATSAARKRPQTESAPPSVAVASALTSGPGGPSPCPFLTSGPSSSASCSDPPPSQHQQQTQLISMPSSARTQSKAESLSPPKRGAGRGKRTSKANSTNAQPPPNSADALASTIASVASGGGSFEIEQRIVGTSPVPPGAAASNPCAPLALALAPQPVGVDQPSPLSSLLAPSTAFLGGASTSSGGQPNTGGTPGGGKRRRGAATLLNSMGNVPQRQQFVQSPAAAQHPYGQQPPQHFGAVQQAQQLEEHLLPSQQKCRIHVQNPPQTHGDFPLTGTKIQVVHMQPPGGQHQQTPMMPPNASPQAQQGRPPQPSPVQQRPPVASEQRHSPFDGLQQNSGSSEMLVRPAPQQQQHIIHPQQQFLHLPQGRAQTGVAPGTPYAGGEFGPVEVPQPLQQSHNHYQNQMAIASHHRPPPSPYGPGPSPDGQTAAAKYPAPPPQHLQQQMFAAPPVEPSGYAQQQRVMLPPQMLSPSPASAPASCAYPPQMHFQQQQQQFHQRHHHPQQQQQMCSPAPPPPPSPMPNQQHRMLPPPSTPLPNAGLQMRVYPAGPSAEQPIPPQQPRAQLSRAQLLSRHARELECRKYALKLYHLQRTVKALVYKNGALADELARLNQRILTVTEERRVLAKRLQHHERNRIRRIQSQYRRAAAQQAAAQAALEVKKEEEEDELDEEGKETGEKLDSRSSSRVGEERPLNGEKAATEKRRKSIKVEVADEEQHPQPSWSELTAVAADALRPLPSTVPASALPFAQMAPRINLSVGVEQASPEQDQLQQNNDTASLAAPPPPHQQQPVPHMTLRPRATSSASRDHSHSPNEQEPQQQDGNAAEQLLNRSSKEIGGLKSRQNQMELRRKRSRSSEQDHHGGPVKGRCNSISPKESSISGSSETSSKTASRPVSRSTRHSGSSGGVNHVDQQQKGFDGTSSTPVLRQSARRQSIVHQQQLNCFSGAGTLDQQNRRKAVGTASAGATTASSGGGSTQRRS